MKRDLKRLSEETFDLLVIGGGIQGAAVAYEATRYGLAVALIEQKDFASATSANSLKIIHGGIRYFQQADLPRIRESVRARREMMALVGDVIQPLPCITPTHGFGLKSREVMRLVIRMYDLVACDRNKGLPEALIMPRGRILSRKECLALFPDAPSKGLSGAALWYDALAMDTERIPLAYIRKAIANGAAAANYLKAVNFIRHRNRIQGIRAVDGWSGRNLEVKAGMVVNASGPWVGEAIRSKRFESLGWVKGINLVVRKKLVTECAVGVERPPGYAHGDNGMLFLVPWRGHTLIGTVYQPYHGNPEKIKMEESDARQFLRLVNVSLPAAKLRLDDVSFFHCGLLPSRAVKGVHASALPDRNAEIVDHEREDGIKGMISIKSVKYTTAPRIAEKVMRLLKAKGIVRAGVRQVQEPREKAVAFPAGFPAGNGPLDREAVFYAVKEEMACRLSDLVFRRTNLGTAGLPPKAVLAHAARTMGEVLGWTPKRIEEEILDVESCYEFRNS